MVLAVCSRDVKFYQWPGMQFLGAYEPPTECMTIRTMSWNENGRTMLVIKSKGQPVLVKTPVEKEKHMEQFTLNVPQHTVSTGVYSKTNPDILALGTERGEIISFDAKSDGFFKSYSKLSSGIQMLDFSSNDKCLLAGCVDGSIHLYDNSSIPAASFMIPFSNKNFSTIKFSDYNPVFAGASREGGLAIWDAASADCILYSKQHNACVTDVAFLENSVMSISRDGFLCIFDLRTSKLTSKNNLDGALSSLTYIPNHNHLVVGTYNQLRCYDTRKLKSPFTTLLINNSGHIKKILSSNPGESTNENHQTLLNSDYIDTLTSMGEYEVNSACGDSFTPSVIDSIQSGQTPKYRHVNYSSERSDKPSYSNGSALEDSNIFKSLEKYTNECIQQATVELSEKIAQKFYTLRINNSKRFIEMESKISDSWDKFVGYLDSAAADSGEEKSESNITTASERHSIHSDTIS